MKPMRLLSFLLCSGALACAGDLSNVKSVYVLTMSHGMDQYLANRLTNSHLFQVVTDPKLAEVFFTDVIGEGLQVEMDTIFPPPEPPKPEKPEPKDDEAPPPNSMFGPTVNKLSNPALASTFGHRKGNIFLVNTKSHEILWSTFAPPKSNSSKDLDQTAADIVSRLKHDLKKK